MHADKRGSEEMNKQVINLNFFIRVNPRVSAANSLRLCSEWLKEVM